MCGGGGVTSCSDNKGQGWTDWDVSISPSLHEPMEFDEWDGLLSPTPRVGGAEGAAKRWTEFDPKVGDAMTRVRESFSSLLTSP